MSSAAACDLVIVGATPAGIAMAVRAAREGARVLLANRHGHLGGMLSSGLGVWDTRHEGRRAPMYDEVRRAILEHYRMTYGDNSPQYRAARPGRQGHTNGRFEPRVAERILTELVAAEPRIRVLTGVHPVAVRRKNRRLATVEFGGARQLTAHAAVFADCTYEADLLPLAGVPFRIGREGRAEQGEPHAGVIFTAPRGAEDQRRRAWRPRLSLRRIPGGDALLPASTGEADAHMQAANYRTILCSDPANRVPIPRPPGYDRAAAAALELTAGIGPLPNRKICLNRPQLPGAVDDFALAGWPARQRVMDVHWHATLSALWFRQHDPDASPAERRRWRRFGLARDEFADNGHRPYEMYVREGRRLAGRYLFTEHDLMPAAGLDRPPLHPDSIGFTDWYVDVHAVTDRRVAGSGRESKMMLIRETVPGQVPYRALLPRGIDNLIVPVILSASHVAWNALRLEPTWMHLAESAAHASMLALRRDRPPAEIDGSELVRTLAARGVALAFFNDVEPGLAAGDDAIAAQYFATRGFFPGYDARLEDCLDAATARIWAEEWRQPRLDPNATARLVAAARRASARRNRSWPAAWFPPIAASESAGAPARGAVFAACWRALAAGCDGVRASGRAALASAVRA